MNNMNNINNINQPINAINTNSSEFRGEGINMKNINMNSETLNSSNNMNNMVNYNLLDRHNTENETAINIDYKDS